MSEIRKCPGCGGDGLVFKERGWCVACASCSWSVTGLGTREEAINAWNIRLSAVAELSRCPFCGGEAKKKRAISDEGQDLFYVQCSLCAARSSPAETGELAISRWEQRNS